MRFVDSGIGTRPGKSGLHNRVLRGRLVMSDMHFECEKYKRGNLRPIYNVTYSMMMEVTYFV
jgi:hypothetical protein